MKQLTLGSLFDGSGGFPLAAWLCGITPVWASEVEPYPIAVTKSRFPNMTHYGDITKINGAEIEPVDIISFGSPCQGLSVAGLRKGLEDARSGLFMEAIRIIKEMRRATNHAYPRFALFENVPGIFSSGTPKGEDFRIVLEEFIQIVEENATVPPPPKGGWPYADAYVGDRWSLAYRTFDTQYWGKSILDPCGRVVQKGTPQRRRRLHLIADFAGGCGPGILFEREGLPRYTAPCRGPWQRIAANAERSAGANDREGKSLINQRSASTGEISATLYAAYGTKWNGNAGAYNGENFVLEEWTDMDTAKQHLFENHWKDARHAGPLDVCSTLPAYLGTGGNNAPLVLENHETASPMGLDGYNSTLTGETSSTLGVNCGMSTGRNGVLVPYLLKIRSGCEGGGKGALWQADKSHTISTHNDQYLFEPIPIHDKATRHKGGGPTRRDDGAGNGLGIGKTGDPVPTLSTCDRHAVMVPAETELILDDQGGQQINVRFDGKVPTIRAEMHGNIPCVLQPAGFKAGSSSKAQGIGWEEEVSPTITAGNSGTNRAPAIAYLANGKDKVGTLMASIGTKQWLGNQEAFSGSYHIIEEHQQPANQQVDSNRKPSIDVISKSNSSLPNDDRKEQIVFEGHQFGGYREGCGSLRASGGDYGGGTENLVVEPKPYYIVRRLTPIECARLQGFPDTWGIPDHKEAFTDEEYSFWLDVRKTHATMNGKKFKDYTKTQMLSWYNKLHSDTAEYKMWGNGIALPPALFCMEGIRDAALGSSEADKST